MRIIKTGLSLLFIALLLYGCGGVDRRALEIPWEPFKMDVVYPRLAEGDSIFVLPRLDSTFAFGSVNLPSAKVFVNDVQAQVWENGAFLAYFPLDTASMTYRFKSVALDGRTLLDSIPFQFPESAVSSVDDSVLLMKAERLPARITIAKNHAVMRTAPCRAYWIFPPQGCKAVADSLDYPYYRVRLTDGLHAWVEERFIDIDTSSAAAPKSVVNHIRTYMEQGWTKIVIPLSEPLLFLIDDLPESRMISIELFGAVAKMDQVNYDSRDSLIREIRWQQIRDDVLHFDILLNSSTIWGYDMGYEGRNLVLKLRHPPDIQRKPLRGRRIALDAGHGGSNLGAIGPTRLNEKDVNLQITLRLQRLLEKAGAEVILTREEDNNVGIYDRIDFAAANGAEMILSIHNNAVADGRNPFENRGSAVYYYHSQSRELARILHSNLLEATDLPDHGFYYKNLALARPTEMLAVLVECAFMMHPEEEMLLRNDRFLDSIAEGLYDGLKEFFKTSRLNLDRVYHPLYYYPETPIIKKPIWHSLTTSKQNE